MRTSCSGCRNGRGRRKTKLFSRENASVFAAMPNASVKTTAAVAARVCSCVRTPNMRSFQKLLTG
jgi:hypothetical protein